MITPDFLEKLDYCKLVKLYGKLNINIVASIIKRILEMGNIDSFTKSQIRKIIELNGQNVFEEVLRETNLLNPEIKKQVETIYDKMIKNNMQDYKKVFEYKGLELKLTQNQINILNIAIKQTTKELFNFTKTIAFSSKTLYVNAVDKAYFEVVTGGRDYISVIEDTVRQLAKEGVTLKDGAGRNVQLETAVRRNLLTGVKMTADNISRDVEKEIGCNGFEVVAHTGARPSHAKAQGKQYALNKTDSKKYNVGLWNDVKDLWNEFNCRHTYFGIILGVSEPAYTDDELLEMKNKKVSYKGQSIPEYDATQIQRRLEREQRYLKRQIKPLEKEKQNIEDLQLRLNQKQTEYKKFCRETGLTPQYERTKVM